MPNMHVEHLMIGEDIRPLPQHAPRVIQTKWPGLCDLCHCPYSKGELVLWTAAPLASNGLNRPSVRRTLQDDGSVLTVAIAKRHKSLAEHGTVTHRTGECGSLWTVQLIWLATSKRLSVAAFAPTDAADLAIRKYFDTNGKPKNHNVPPVAINVFDLSGQRRFWKAL